MHLDVSWLIDSFLSLQMYIVDAGLDKPHQDEGLEVAGIPEGIPSLAEYLAEYCSAAVRSISLVSLNSCSLILCTYAPC